MNEMSVKFWSKVTLDELIDFLSITHLEFYIADGNFMIKNVIKST